jgi:hypothetical protein
MHFTVPTVCLRTLYGIVFPHVAFIPPLHDVADELPVAEELSSVSVDNDPAKGGIGIERLELEFLSSTLLKGRPKEFEHFGKCLGLFSVALNRHDDDTCMKCE